MNKAHCQIIFLCTYFIFSQHLCLFIPLSSPLPPPFIVMPFPTFVSLLWLLPPLLSFAFHTLPRTPSPALLSSLYHFGFCCSWQAAAAAAALKCGRLHGQLVIDGRGASVCVCVWQSKSANSFRKHLSGALCWWFMTARERERERWTACNGIESEKERGESGRDL